MSAYDALPPAVKAKVDELAAALAINRGCTVEEAREIIAKDCRTTTVRVTKGH